MLLNKNAKLARESTRYLILNTLKNKKKIRIKRIIKTKLLYYTIKATKTNKAFVSILITLENAITFTQILKKILK